MCSDCLLDMEKAVLSEAIWKKIAPPPASRTNRRSEAGEAAIESAEREDSNAH